MNNVNKQCIGTWYLVKVSWDLVQAADKVDLVLEGGKLGADLNLGRELELGKETKSWSWRVEAFGWNSRLARELIVSTGNIWNLEQGLGRGDLRWEQIVSPKVSLSRQSKGSLHPHLHSHLMGIMG